MDINNFPQLTFEQLSDELNRYEYRHGQWKLDIYNDPHEGPCLDVTAVVPDSYNPGETTTLRIRSAIPPIETAEYFGKWLLWRLMQIEVHECREMLWRDGWVYRDPHDPLQPTKEE